MFFKSESCRLLDDPTGPAAQRFIHYDAFLNHNHRVLRILSELELLGRGAGLATPASIQRRAKKLLQVFERVAGTLGPLIERKREPIRGLLTLPLSALDTEHLPLAGAKAVNRWKSSSSLLVFR